MKKLSIWSKLCFFGCTLLFILISLHFWKSFLAEKIALSAYTPSAESCNRIKRYLSAGAYPDYFHVDRTLLEIAIDNDNGCVAKALLESGANRDALGPANKKRLSILINDFNK